MYRVTASVEFGEDDDAQLIFNIKADSAADAIKKAEEAYKAADIEAEVLEVTALADPK